MNLTGYNPLSLDSQKRLAIPARYRRELEEASENTLVVTLGLDTANPFLELYPLPEWQKKLEKIGKMSNLYKVTQLIKRRVVGHATELTLDKSARILIPQALREQVNISKEAVLSGVGEKFELWNAEAWNKARDIELTEEDFARLPEDIMRDF